MSLKTAIQQQTATTVQATPIIADTAHISVPSTNVQGQIDDLSKAIKAVPTSTSESVTVGNGTAPAIPAANDANWKLNTPYVFNADATIPSTTLADGTVVTKVEKGSILKIVKTGATTFGYVLIDSTDKTKGYYNIGDITLDVINDGIFFRNGKDGQTNFINLDTSVKATYVKSPLIVTSSNNVNPAFTVKLRKYILISGANVAVDICTFAIPVNVTVDTIITGTVTPTVLDLDLKQNDRLFIEISGITTTTITGLAFSIINPVIQLS